MTAKPAESHSAEINRPTLDAGTTSPGSAPHGRPSDRAGTRAPEDLPFRCACGARWGGYRTCHCAAAECHRTFGGVTAFDAHRFHGTCLEPSGAGMSLLAGRVYECWGFPERVVRGQEMLL